MTEFFEMGGYGGYVWPAYAVSAMVIAALIFLIRRRHNSLRQRLTAAQNVDSAEANAKSTRTKA